MSDNVEVLRRVYGKWAKGELASSSLALFAESVVLVVDPGIPDGGTYVGPGGVRDYTLRFLEPWESLSIAAEFFEEAGDTVLVAVRQSGTGRGSGVAVEMKYFQVWTFRAGQVTRLDVIMSEERARKALDGPELAR